MVNCLFVLISLESLRLESQSSLFSPDLESRHLSPPTNVVLPALKDFQFKGVSEYLEELVACIDAPHLNYLTYLFVSQSNLGVTNCGTSSPNTPMGICQSITYR